MAAVRRGRSGRVTVGCLLLLVVLGVIGLVVGDRVADRVAEDAAAARLRQQGVMPDPHVVVNGYPFLTQLISRDFDDVRVTSSKATLAGGREKVTLEDVGLQMRGVRPDAAYEKASVRSLNGHGRLGWDAISSSLRAPVRYGGTSNGRGRMQLEYRFQFNGQSVLITASGVPRIDPATQKMRLEDPKADVGGMALDSKTIQTMLDRATQPMPLSLPQGMKVQDVSATQAGLRLSLSGENVTLPQ